MPKESIYSDPTVKSLTEDEMGLPDDLKGRYRNVEIPFFGDLSVYWVAGRNIILNVYDQKEDGRYLVSPHVILSEEGVSRLISILRRAKRKAFPKPEA